MSILFVNNLDLNQNELQNARIQNLASDPSSPVEGQVYYNTTDDNFYGRVAAAWARLNNLSAAETLTLLLGVDGTGTGLDADLLDGQHLSYVIARGNHTGTQTASTISDFDTQVRTSRLDQMAVPPAAVSFNSQKITNLATPTAAGDAVNKSYADSLSAGLDPKASVRAATTAAGTLATSFENGDAIDGVTLATGDRILIKDQADAAENGIYVVAASGAPTRADDADTGAELSGGAFVFVEEGTVNADTGWVASHNGEPTLGTDDVTFTQFSGAGTIVAGAGLTKTGSTIDAVGTADRITVNADSIDIAATYVGQASITTLGTIATGTWEATDVAVAHGGTGASTAAAARTNLSALGRYSATIGNGSATSFNISQATHGMAADGTNTVAVYDATSGAQVYPDVTVAPGTGQVTIAFAVAPTTNQYRVVIQGVTA